MQTAGQLLLHLHYTAIFTSTTSFKYGDSVDNTLYQQNPPVLNWSCRLTQLYNGHKTVAIVVVVFVVVVLAWYHFTPFVCLSVS